MIFADVKNHIGEKVYMNGRGDLAMSQPFRKYLYPRPEPEPIFTIIKVTKSGLVQIQAENGELMSLGCKNIDLVEGYEEPSHDPIPDEVLASYKLEPVQPIKAYHQIELDKIMLETITNELIKGLKKDMI